MKIIAVCGWAIPQDWFREIISNAFPCSDVVTLYPQNPMDSEEAKELLNANTGNLYIGYSLGSLWLLLNKKYIPAGAHKILIAPILSLKAEMNKGGKIKEAQLHYLIKLLSRDLDDQKPVADFLTLCEIPVPEPEMAKVPSRSVLLNGLKFFATCSANAGDAFDFICLLGKNDQLLDWKQLQKLIPQLEVVEDAGHSPLPLLKKLRENSKLLNLINDQPH